MRNLCTQVSLTAKLRDGDTGVLHPQLLKAINLAHAFVSRGVDDPVAFDRLKAEVRQALLTPVSGERRWQCTGTGFPAFIALLRY